MDVFYNLSYFLVELRNRFYLLLREQIWFLQMAW